MNVEIGQYHRNARGEVLPYVPAGADRILDVGCAAGGFGAALKGELRAGRDRPPVVHGVEPNPAAAALARDVLDRVHEGPFDEKALAALSEGTPYSCIVFNDVLEHMERPEDALELARGALGADGVVVASIPNIRNWSTLHGIIRQGRFEYTEKGVLDRTHLRFFCRRDMEVLFESCGFEVVLTQGISSLDVRIWKRWKLASKLLGNGLAEEGRFKQFVIVARFPR